MKKIAAAVCLSLASIAAMAQGTQKPLTVQVDLTLDNQTVAHIDAVMLKDPFGVAKPFAFRNGDVAGDIICSRTANGNTTTTKLLAQEKFVGLSVEFTPVAEHDGKIFGHVTVQNTTEAGSHDEKDAAGCTSRYVDTTGLKPTSFDVAIAANADTIAAVPVPTTEGMQASHYVLKFKPVQD